MKLLLISSLYQPYVVGGAERVAQKLAEGLLGRGHEVEVITTAPDGKERRENINGVPVDFIRVRNLYHPFGKDKTPSAGSKLLFHAVDSWNPAMAAVVRQKLRAFSPNVVNSHNITGFSPAIFQAACDEAVPLVHTLHDQYLLCPKTTMYRKDNCVRQCLSCWPYAKVRSWQSKVDLAIGVSAFILDRHREFGIFRNSATRVILNAAPNRPASTVPRVPGPLRFGYLGQIRATKGLHVLVEAFMTERLQNAELHIAGRGDPDYELRLRNATQSHSGIRWAGFVDSNAFLDSIDVLVVPSLWNDTAPLVLLEAFAASRPVIASCRGGIPEFVAPGTGWVFDPAQPSQLGALLRECVVNPARLAGMGAQARLVAERQSAAKFLDDYQDAFAGVHS